MLQKSSMQKTMEIFFKSPTEEHYLMDISKKIEIAHTSVKANLIKLQKIGLINEKIKKFGKRIFPTYVANYENITFRQYKMIFNISSLLQSGLIEFLEEKVMPKSIVIFGSYRRGEDIEDSDVDIFIESSQKEIAVKKFEKILSRKIQLHFNENFISYSKELKNNIINGIILNGFLEGYK